MKKDPPPNLRKRPQKRPGLRQSRSSRLSLLLIGTAALAFGSALVFVLPARVPKHLANLPNAPLLPSPGLVDPNLPKPVYRLVVRGKQIRQHLGERIVLTLQVVTAGRVRVQIYNRLGQMVRELADLHDPRGPIILDWDGRLADGPWVPSGAYTLRIQSPDKTEKVQVQVNP